MAARLLGLTTDCPQRRCAWAPPGEPASEGEGEGEGEGWDGLWAGELESRRLVRFTLSEALDALSAVDADEVHEARAGGEAAVKARAWVQLRLRSSQPAARGAAAASLDAALAALPPAYRAERLPLQPASVPQVRLSRFSNAHRLMRRLSFVFLLK